MATTIGILSDSHGQRLRVRRGLEILRAAGATEFVHLGDVGDGVLDELAGLPCRIVFGNCDDAAAWERYATDIGLEVLHPAGIFEVDGKRIGITHGHLLDALDALFGEGVDYLLHGHTHQRSDATVDGVRVLNPGALHRATPPSVAILVPAEGRFEWFLVDAR
jgi:putative phosphoesterase